MKQKTSGQLWLCERARGAGEAGSKVSAPPEQGSAWEVSQFLVQCRWLRCEPGSWFCGGWCLAWDYKPGWPPAKSWQTWNHIGIIMRITRITAKMVREDCVLLMPASLKHRMSMTLKSSTEPRVVTANDGQLHAISETCRCPSAVALVLFNVTGLFAATKLFRLKRVCDGVS